MNLTPEQSLAVNKEGSNIIVSAGAGSGKTAVLSERVIRKLKEGTDIRDILMLTFTNEAAGEMLDRIRKKMKKAELYEQLEYLDEASITTFDAFALKLVKKYHYILNISKRINIIDDSIMTMKKNEYLEEIFIKLYEEKNELFLKLVDNFTTRADDDIKSAILNINKKLDLKYNKKEYLDTYIDNYYSEEYITKIFNEYFSYIKDLCTLLEDNILSIESFMEESSYIKLYDSVSKLFRPNNYNDLYKNKDSNIGRFTKLDEDGKELKEKIKKTYEEIKELTKFSEEEVKGFYLSTKNSVKIIIDIINELDVKIKEFKFKSESFEFTDIAKMAIQIVKENEIVRCELKGKFKEIMVDEYQDTSDLQEEFIKLIENNNVYMVGDIKQSIYRFRNANPFIFKNKYDLYSQGMGGVKIDLLKNFRSRQEVLANINDIFRPLMTKEIGGINYKESHEMIYGNLAYINEGLNEDNNNLDILTYEENDMYSNDEIEAFVIAKDIRDKVSNDYQVYDFDLKALRDSNYSDYCIILDRNSSMGLYKKIFEYFNIPMEIYKDNNLMDDSDIYIIKNIISLILSIKKGVYDKEFRYLFYSVARSFVGNLNDAEIFECLENNKVYSSEVYKICLSLSKDIDYITPNMLLKRIIDKFKFYEKFILVGNIEACNKRINYLLELAHNIEDLGLTIEEFKDYLDTLVDSKMEVRYKEAKSGTVSVKMMNIHKSKGLEFPVCYFAGFKKKFNVMDLKSKFMFDDTYGILTPFYHEGVGESFVKVLVSNNYYLNEVAEKIRLFYVALTRAKEKMIMVMPRVEDFKKVDEVNYLDGINFRSFYNFLEGISGNIKHFMKPVKLDDLGLTKNYEFVLSLKNNSLKSNDIMEFRDIDFLYEVVEKKHASKTIKSLLTEVDANTLMFGTHMHEVLELTDFKENSANKYVNELKKTFDFAGAAIYQELEFVYDDEGINYHGIIDLMLEYEDKILIVDYKLKNIEDEAYIKQLKVYLDYIESISDKEVSLFLYSILDNKVKEIKF